MHLRLYKHFTVISLTIFNFFAITLFVTGQATCPIEDILTFTDLLQFEHRLAHCVDQFDGWQIVLDEMINHNGSPLETGRYKMLSGIIKLKSGNGYQARFEFADAVAKAREAGMPAGAGLERQAFYYWGLALTTTGTYADGETNLFTARKKAIEADDYLIIGRVDLLRADAALRANENNSASELFSMALDQFLAVPVQSIPEQINALESLAMLADIYQQYSLARLYRDQVAVLHNDPNVYDWIDNQATGTSAPCTIFILDEASAFFETTSAIYQQTERNLQTCSIDELHRLQAQTQDLLSVDRPLELEAHLKTFSGLIYFAAQNYYEAYQIHGKTIEDYRALIDPEKVGLTFYYMARSYAAARQDTYALLYFNEALKQANAVGDFYTIGRSYLGLGRYTYDVVKNNDEAVEYLELALEALDRETLEVVALPEQLEIRNLLSRAYAALGRTAEANQQDIQIQVLSSAQFSVRPAKETPNYEAMHCQLDRLAAPSDLIFIERQLPLCRAEIPRLMLTAQAFLHTTSDPSLKGLAQAYIGMNHYALGHYTDAETHLGRALEQLRDGDIYYATGPVYVYLISSYYDHGRPEQAERYLDTARSALTLQSDSFESYYLSVLDKRLAEQALAQHEYQQAANLYEMAFGLLEASLIPYHARQLEIAGQLRDIYHVIANRELDHKEWSNRYDALMRAGPTNAQTEQVHIFSDPTCAQNSFLNAGDDLVDVEKHLVDCLNAMNLNTLLSAAETAVNRAESEAERLHYNNLVGILWYYLKEYNNARLVHEGVLTAYRNGHFDPVLEGRTAFYFGRSQFERGETELGENYLDQAETTLQNGGGDPLGLAIIRETQADFFLEAGEYDSALQLYSQASDEFEKGNRPEYALPLLLITAQLYDQRSVFETAQGRFNRAIEIAQELRSSNAEGTKIYADASSYEIEARLGLARYEKYLGHFDKASEQIDIIDEIKLAQTTDDLALVDLERVDIARLKGDLVEAGRLLNSLDISHYSCGVTDQVNLLRGAYLVNVGRTAEAYTTFLAAYQSRCEERSAVIEGLALAGIADARLALHETGESVLEAVNESWKINNQIDADDEIDPRGYPRGYQRAYMQLARFNGGRREYVLAEEQLATARAKAERVNDQRALADIMLIQVEFDIARGRYANALENLEISEQLYNDIGYNNALLSTLESRLQIYLNQANYRAAGMVIAEARNNYVDLPLAYEGLIQFYEGQAAAQQGQTLTAQGLYQDALKTFADTEQEQERFDVSLRLIELRHRLGEYEIALDIIDNLEADEAQPLINSFNQKKGRSYDSLLAIATDLAPNTAQECVRLSAINDSDFQNLINENLIISRNNLAAIYLIRGENQLQSWIASDSTTNNMAKLRVAQTCFNEALANYTNAQNQLGQARAHMYLGELRVIAVEYNIGQMELSPNGDFHLNRAWSIYDDLANSYGKSEALFNLGRLYLFLENNRDYQTIIDRLHEANRLAPENDPYRRAAIHTHLGLAFEYRWQAENNLDYRDAAINEYEKAAEFMAYTYAEIGDETVRRQFGTLDATLFPYNRLIDLLVDRSQGENRKDIALAFFYAEQSRARSFVTQLQRSAIDFSQLPNGDLVREWIVVRNEINDLNQQRSVILAGTSDDAETSELDVLVTDRIQRLATLENEIDEPTLLQLLSVSVNTWDTLASSIPNNTTMLIYYTLPPHRRASTTPGQAQIISFLITQHDIDMSRSIIGNYQQEIVDQVTALQDTHRDNAASNLYRYLIAPHESDLPKLRSQVLVGIPDVQDSLVIVPHAELNYIDFDLLTSGSSSPKLIDSYNIHYVPSATIYSTLLRSINPVASSKTLALGYSGLGYDFRPLTSVKSEIEGIGNYLDSVDFFVEQDAKKSILTPLLLSNYDLIHFAAHGVFLNDNPLESYIALAPDPTPYTGQLQVNEIYEWDLHGRHPLVTISACNLGNSVINPGDELEGFARAFLLSGARGVVASLWKVEDSIADEFMQKFYALRQVNRNNAAALSQAKREMRDKYREFPEYWAGFILIGLNY